jgi:hypothetical protein
LSAGFANFHGLVVTSKHITQAVPMFNAYYPLVNVYKKLWKITMLLMGKLTISMAIFNSYVSLPEGMSKCSAFFGMSSGCVGCGTAP